MSRGLARLVRIHRSHTVLGYSTGKVFLAVQLIPTPSISVLVVEKKITRKNFDGCHVQKCGLVDRKWYVMPLCDSCNHRTDMFSVDEKLLLPVPSNL